MQRYTEVKNQGILIAQIGRVQGGIQSFLKDSLQRTFQRETYAGPSLPVPVSAFSHSRRQYLATAVLQTIFRYQEYVPHERVLGVSGVDLYVPELNFVFGVAAGRGALISTARLWPRWRSTSQSGVIEANGPEVSEREAGLVNSGDSVQKELFLRRVLTEAVHELGHTYGCMHCSNPKCVMFFSNSLQDTDRKGPDFCSQCAKLI
jgi:archaemetzincin